MEKKLTNPKVLALIPARGGSKGIPRKNVRNFLGKPLVAWSIEAALNANSVNQVVVSTNDKEIMEASSKYGADIPLIRPDNISQDDSTRNQVVNHVLSQFNNLDYIVVLQPTSPLRTSQHIDQAFNLLLRSGADACVSVVPQHAPPEWTFTLTEDSKLEPLPGYVIKPLRQKVSKYYALNGAIYITKVENFLNSPELDPFVGSNSIAYVMPEELSVDIDNENDWFMAEQLMRKTIG